MDQQSDQQLVEGSTAQRDDSSILAHLRNIPSFDIRQCHVPRGQELHALKELILACEPIADTLTPWIIYKGVATIFHYACDSLQHSEYSGGHDGIWLNVWETGPWRDEPCQYADHTTPKAAVDFYFNGLKGSLRAGRRFWANHEEGPGLAMALAAVARWVEMVEGPRYEVLIRPRVQRPSSLEEVCRYERAVLVAERDVAKAGLNAAIAERDALRTELDKVTNTGHAITTRADEMSGNILPELRQAEHDPNNIPNIHPVMIFATTQRLTPSTLQIHPQDSNMADSHSKALVAVGKHRTEQTTAIMYKHKFFD
ncbi:Ribonuclease T2 precursor (RNase T2) [Hypoxylon texense]